MLLSQRLLLIEKFNPEVVINTGSAGALDQTLSIGDILVSNHVLYHDANVLQRLVMNMDKYLKCLKLILLILLC